MAYYSDYEQLSVSAQLRGLSGDLGKTAMPFMEFIQWWYHGHIILFFIIIYECLSFQSQISVTTFDDKSYTDSYD